MKTTKKHSNIAVWLYCAVVSAAYALFVYWDSTANDAAPAFVYWYAVTIIGVLVSAFVIMILITRDRGN